MVILALLAFLIAVQMILTVADVIARLVWLLLGVVMLYYACRRILGG